MGLDLDPARDLGFTKVPQVAGFPFHGRLMVCGAGRSLWDDLRAVLDKWERGGSFHTMAVKQVGMYLPWKPEHWAGAHGERFQWMVPLRRDHYYFKGRVNERGVYPNKLGIKVHAEKGWPLVDYAWEGPLTGTSGLFAVRIGLALGYDEIALCGMPLDGLGRFYDAPWNHGPDLNVVDMSEWEKFLPVFKGRVRSMSGRTRELLGGL